MECMDYLPIISMYPLYSILIEKGLSWKRIKPIQIIHIIFIKLCKIFQELTRKIEEIYTFELYRETHDN